MISYVHHTNRCGLCTEFVVYGVCRSVAFEFEFVSRTVVFFTHQVDKLIIEGGVVCERSSLLEEIHIVLFPSPLNLFL